MDYLVLFTIDAGLMILELVASRLMSPYFGNSNFVWTAIIGIILLAGSLGNIIGGKIASKKNPRVIVGLLLFISAIYITVTPMINVPVLEGIRDGEMGTQFSSVLGSIIFFLIPSTILGMVPPIIMKERIGESKDKGKESGRITAIIAIGSLVGTFLGGFFLIPTFGTNMIFVIVAIMIIISTLLLRPFKEIDFEPQRPILVVTTILAIAMSIISLVYVTTGSGRGETESISIDTEYGRIIIEDDELDGERIRCYRQSGSYSSATFLNDDRKYELVYDYLKKYDLMFDFTDVKSVAMIGGAAYQYPKYYISHFPDKSMDVIEIDPESTRIARKYFYLDDLIDDYNLEENKRLGLYNEDGRVFLDDSDKKYDAILNDAFSGEVPVATLSTREAVKIIKHSLKDGGVYMSNILGAVDGDKGRFLRSEVKTLKDVFDNVYVVPVYDKVENDKYINWMVIATDSNRYEPDDAINVNLTDDDIVLTDDYNPVDSMTSTKYRD